MAFDNKYLQGNLWTPGTNWITVGAYLQFSEVEPGSDLDFLRISKDAAGQFHFGLGFGGGGSGGDVAFINQSDFASRATANFSMPLADTWYLIEAKFKQDSSSDLRIWLDKSLKFSTTSKDFDNGGTQSRVEIRTQTANVDPLQTSPRCIVTVGSWYVRLDNESTSELVDMVGFGTGGLEEVKRSGDSTIETSPAPHSSKETYVCKVIAGSGADPSD